jgi:hypothetical protein
LLVQAASKYRDALKHWDHPAIHYNLVLALVNLDQPLEMHEHLVAAMKYGEAPLDTEKFTQAKNYLLIVEKQLAKVEIKCDEPGAKVSLDGQPLFTAPGHEERFVRAGSHNISATKDGFVPNQQARTLPAGEITPIDLKLYTEDDVTQYRRRWSAWMPWTVLGAGVLVAGGGGFMHYQASQSFHSFDQGINACGGCIPSSNLVNQKNTGNTLQTAAFGAYVVGGGALIAGAALVYVNRPQPYLVTPGQEKTELSFSILPFLSPQAGGFSAQINF